MKNLNSLSFWSIFFYAFPMILLSLFCRNKVFAVTLQSRQSKRNTVLSHIYNITKLPNRYTWNYEKKLQYIAIYTVVHHIDNGGLDGLRLF